MMKMERKVKKMNDKYTTVYFILNDDGSDTKIKQLLTQKELGNLLLRDDVILSSVNAESKSYYRRKKKGR